MKVANGMQVPSTTLLRYLRQQLRSDATFSSQQLPSSRRFKCLSTATTPISHPSSIKHRATNHDRLALQCSPARQNIGLRGTFACFARQFSTSKQAQDWSWLRSNSSRREDRYRDDDLLPLLGLDESTGLGGRIQKPSNELRMRCTEFDEHGNVVLVSGEFKKHELIAKYSLLPRDLRKIDSSVLPSILVRPSAILINLLHIRCLIKHDRVLVFDVYGSTDTYAQSLFMYDLEGKLRQKQTSLGGALPYEFRALEAVLISVMNGLETEFEGVREPVIRVLRELEEDIDRDKLRHLLIYSKKLSTFEQKARLVRDAIDEILEADDDLAAMYLTEKVAGGEREEDNHEEIELLLESYYNVADEICQISSNLVTSIKNTEEIIRAILDSNRNSLMLLDLKFSVLTLGTTVGMFIAALYGMNLENFIEESNYGFFGITGLSVLLTGFASMYGLSRLRKLQRVRIWHDRGAMREARARAAKLRRDTWQQLEHGSGSDRGLGETVAGIRSREAIKNWRQAHSDQLKQFEASRQAQGQASKQAAKQIRRQNQVKDDGTLPVGA